MSSTDTTTTIDLKTPPPTVAPPEVLLVDAKDAAAMLGMAKSTLWEAVKNGEVPQPVKIRGLTRWRVSDLRQHVQAMCSTTP